MSGIRLLRPLTGQVSLVCGSGQEDVHQVAAGGCLSVDALPALGGEVCGSAGFVPGLERENPIDDITKQTKSIVQVRDFLLTFCPILTYTICYTILRVEMTFIWEYFYC